MEREGRRERASHLPMREWDKVTQDSPEKQDRRREDGKGADKDRKEKRARVGLEETPAKLLDDLFQKTKATPCIYWLPLTQEQAKARTEQARIERERRHQEQENKRPHSKPRSREMVPYSLAEIQLPESPGKIVKPQVKMQLRPQSSGQNPSLANMPIYDEEDDSNSNPILPNFKSSLSKQRNFSSDLLQQALAAKSNLGLCDSTKMSDALQSLRSYGSQPQQDSPTTRQVSNPGFRRSYAASPYSQNSQLQNEFYSQELQSSGQEQRFGQKESNLGAGITKELINEVDAYEGKSFVPGTRTIPDNEKVIGVGPLTRDEFLKARYQKAQVVDYGHFRQDSKTCDLQEKFSANTDEFFYDGSIGLGCKIQPVKLFVANISCKVDMNEIDKIFSRVGQVIDIKLTDSLKKRRSFGTVTMGSAEDAKKAIVLLDGKMLKGENMVVKMDTRRSSSQSHSPVTRRR